MTHTPILETTTHLGSHRPYLLAAATVLMGLSAGLFTTFSYAVMPGLARTDDAAFVQSMRGINDAILNPVFALVFVGALLATVAALVAGWGESWRPWVIAGLALYLAVLAVTFAANVPLNDSLKTGTDTATALRSHFEDNWVLLNHLRSLLSTAAFVSLVIGLVTA
jgi:uncharacterized membrane protein